MDGIDKIFSTLGMKRKFLWRNINVELCQVLVFLKTTNNMTPQEIITEIKRQLTELKFEDGEYCLVVLKTNGYMEVRRKDIFKVYKSFTSFESDIERCINSISSDYGVDIDIWKFDE
jgi:hypothetical protein